MDGRKRKVETGSWVTGLVKLFLLLIACLLTGALFWPGSDEKKQRALALKRKKLRKERLQRRTNRAKSG